MTRTLTLSGAVDAVDTRVLLTGQGSVATPSLVVPAGKNKIIAISASIAADGLADDGSYIFIVRLGGVAVLNGESTFVLAGGGNQTVQSGSDAAPSVCPPVILEGLDLAVSPSDTVAVSAEIAGVDPGDTQVMVTLIFGE